MIHFISLNLKTSLIWHFRVLIFPLFYIQMRRLLTRKSKETIQRPIENEVDYQDGVLRVSAPQFNKSQCPVKLDPLMTARDLLTR